MHGRSAGRGRGQRVWMDQTPNLSSLSRKAICATSVPSLLVFALRDGIVAGEFRRARDSRQASSGRYLNKKSERSQKDSSLSFNSELMVHLVDRR
eukprot:4015175-Prymnesium_polylepis.1